MFINIKGLLVDVDEEDVAFVQSHTWYIEQQDARTGGLYYFVTNMYVGDRRVKQKMHRLLAGCTSGDGNVVDHKDGNTLNNKKDNLRICTSRENSRNAKTPKTNTSGRKGVSFRNNKYVANIKIDGKTRYIGAYDYIEDAYAAYCAMAIEYFGDFARLK